MSGRQCSRETARNFRLTLRSIGASLAAVCFLGSVIAVGLVSPVSAASSSHSKTLGVAPLVVEPTCPAASLVNTYLGVDVSLFQSGGVSLKQCFYWNKIRGQSTEILIYVVRKSATGSGIPYTEMCGGKAPKACKLVPLKDPGTVASYFNNGGEIGVNVFEHGWLVETEFPLGGPGVQGGLQAALKKAKSLSNSLPSTP